MINLIKSKLNLRVDFSSYDEYKKCISDLVQNETVWTMGSFVQHSDITCLEHSIYVSYISFLVCRRFNFDYCSAARGGLLHDFFLYDWHIKESHDGLHGFVHPYTALRNANKCFDLNDMEKDIIVKHMWPLTLKLPKYKEALIVSFVDKYCAIMEIVKIGNRAIIHRLIRERYLEGAFHEQ